MLGMLETRTVSDSSRCQGRSSVHSSVLLLRDSFRAYGLVPEQPRSCHHQNSPSLRQRDRIAAMALLALPTFLSHGPDRSIGHPIARRGPGNGPVSIRLACQGRTLLLRAGRHDVLDGSGPSARGCHMSVIASQQ
jgi:hypothetical protein